MNGRHGGEQVARWFFFLCGLVTVVCVAAISLYLVTSGVPMLRKYGVIRFLFGTVWSPTGSEPSFGILPFLLASFVGAVGALVLGIPVGLCTAVYLAKLAPPRAARWARSAVELLAGIPSVVYGLVGIMVLCPRLMKLFGWKSGATLLAAILVLAVMILPTLISVSETALRAVPKEYEEGSLALGAAQMETITRVSIPAARSGITAGVVLGVGRAIGETMAVLMVAGNVANLPRLSKPVTFLTTAIAKELGYASGDQKQALFSIGLVLFLVIMAINGLLRLYRKGRRDQ